MQRIEIIAKGEVQGVNYRSRVRKIAEEFGVVGYVENLENREVKIVAEGEEKVLRNFAKAVKLKENLINVQELKVKFMPASGEFKSFKIKYLGI